MNTTTTPKTPVLSATDNRGLPVRVLQYNIDAAGTPCCLVTHTLANDASHIMQHRDPRRFTAWVRDSTEAPNLTSIPSLTGQVLRRDSTDSGWQVTLYDAEGRPAWMTDGRGTVNRVDYDILGRPLTRYTRSAGNSADQASARYVYGDADTQTSVPQGNNLRGICVRKYDEGGRLSVDQVALSGALLSQGQTFLRSAEGQPDWQGQESDWAALLEVGNNVVQTTTVTANAQGAALSQTDAAGHSLFWAYDVAGSVSNQSLTLSGQSPQVLLTSLSYSAAGQPLAEVAGNDVTTTYVYEPQTQRLSNISAVRRGDSITLQNLSYIYDPVGNIINITDGTVGIRYFRNQATDGIRIFTYDALYQLVSATGRENAGAGTQNGALPAITPLPEGDTAYSPYTRNYTYDGSGNLITLSHIGDNCYSQTMVTDTFSNRSVQQDSSDSLAPDDVGSYFDVSGNLQQLHAQTLPATDDNYGLVWDTDNQLQTAILVNRNQGSDSSQSDRELYQYRDGMRVRKQTRTLTNTDTGLWTVSEVRYLPGLEMRNTWQETVTEGGISSPTYSEQLEVATTQAGRSQIRVLHWVLGQPTDVERDQVRYSVDDQVGSLVLELDSTGQLISREEYYPYGGTAVWSSRNQTEASYKTVRYSGKERDGTGLCYYGYRYYAPWLCRWLNADPAGEVDGLNLFRMCRNNPVSMLDNDGRLPSLSCFGPSAKQRFNAKMKDELSTLNDVNIPKKIHMIWIGTGNISNKNIDLSLETASKNPDYETRIIYDSGINGYESARSYLADKFSGSSVKIIDLRRLPYFSSVSSHPAFKYYEEAVRQKKYAQASDLLRLHLLENEGGIYKDIDDTQLESFGSLSFPKGIGFKGEYAAAPDGSKASAVPNTPIAAAEKHPVISKTLELAIENYKNGEENVLKLAGPDVFTKALYNTVPFSSRNLLSHWDEIKQGIFKDKNQELNMEEIRLLNEPKSKMLKLGKFVTNGSDHSWVNR
jgi:insecticidal toxin complex protein TccC